MSKFLNIPPDWKPEDCEEYRIVLNHVYYVEWSKGRRYFYDAERKPVVTDGFWTRVKKYFTKEKLNWKIGPVADDFGYTTWYPPTVNVKYGELTSTYECKSNDEAFKLFQDFEEQIRDNRNR